MPNFNYNIIDVLYQCRNQKRYAVRGFSNKVKGYGLKPSEFENFKEEGCSRNIFNKSKKFLLDSHYIEAIDTNKTKSTTHKPRYKITLLGLLQLFKIREIGYDDYNEILKMFSESDVVDLDNSCVSIWSYAVRKRIPKTPYQAYQEMFDGINSKILIKLLKKIISEIETEYKDDHLSISLLSVLSENSIIEFWHFSLKNNNVICNGFPATSFERKPSKSSKLSTEYKKSYTIQELNSMIVDFILKLMWFYLSTKYKKSLPKYLLFQKSKNNSNKKLISDYLKDPILQTVKAYSQIWPMSDIGKLYA